MFEIVVVLFAFVLVALVVTVIRAGGVEEEREILSRGSMAVQPALVRTYPYLPWMAGGALALTLYLSLDLLAWIAAAIGVLTGVTVGILLRFLAARRISRLEFQLADGIDLMVSTLRAGGGLTDALTSAAAESRRPFRVYVRELVERIRLGEQPGAVLADLEARVPLESFRLFTFTLAAHWEGGGSLATTLSNVGRTIRDRVDVARRVRSQAVETQVSVIGVLGVTYGLALLMWNNYPERLETFATSELGSMFIGLSILLPGIGLLWISRMTRIEV